MPDLCASFRGLAAKGRRALVAALVLLALTDGVAPARAQCGGRWLTSPEQSLTGLNDALFALGVVPGGDLLAGGPFTTAAGVTANHIARWTGASWAPLGSGMNDWVVAFAVAPNGDLVAGGYFATDGGVTVNNIARWNGVSWAPLGAGMGAAPGLTHGVYTLAMMPNGDLVAGGSFSTAGGATANNIARWNGSSWAPLGSGMDGFVAALVVLPNGDLVAGGSFTTAGGGAANRIARWNGSSWAPLGTGANTYVNALALLPNGDLVAGGQFTMAGGVTANFIASWRASTGQWAPMGTGMSGPVYALIVLHGGDLIASGGFLTAGGVAGTKRIARWNGSAWSPLGSGMDLPVNALAVLPNGELVAGGNFNTAGGAPSYFWARWTDTGVPWFARQPTGPRTIPFVGGALAGAFAVTPASGYDFNGPLTFRWRRNGVNINNGATANGTIISGANTATLSFSNTSILDSGRYSCVISNTCGSATSAGALLAVASSACPGDANGDGVVGFADLNLVLDRYGTTTASPGTGGDVTGNGVVDFFDLNLVLATYGTGC